MQDVNARLEDRTLPTVSGLQCLVRKGRGAPLFLLFAWSRTCMVKMFLSWLSFPFPGPLSIKASLFLAFFWLCSLLFSGCGPLQLRLGHIRSQTKPNQTKSRKLPAGSVFMSMVPSQSTFFFPLFRIFFQLLHEFCLGCFFVVEIGERCLFHIVLA